MGWDRGVGELDALPLTLIEEGEKGRCIEAIETDFLSLPRTCL